MKLEEYRPSGGEIYFKNNGVYGILKNLFKYIMGFFMTPETLQILACPICKGELSQTREPLTLDCKTCNKTYPVIDGIPILLPEHPDTNLKTKCEEL